LQLFGIIESLMIDSTLVLRFKNRFLTYLKKFAIVGSIQKSSFMNLF